MTTRWSISSFTGSDRTLVAVGTVSDRSMFFAVRAGAPRSVVRTGASSATSGRTAGFGGSAGTPPRLPGVTGRPSLLVVGLSTVGLGREVVSLAAGTAAGAGLAAGAGRAAGCGEAAFAVLWPLVPLAGV